MNSISLTSKQISYMEFVNNFIVENDNFPPLSIIAGHFGVNPNAALNHLQALEKKGYLAMCDKVQKYRRTAPFKTFIQIRGKVAA